MTSRRPTISIAMCTYIGGSYLQEQLDSLATQVRPPDELVVCDDRSTEGTVDLLRNFAQRVDFPVRLYVNEQNLGTTKNFEKAISTCSGDIIALSDQDDVWHPGKLERLETIFMNSPETGAVFSDAKAVDAELVPLGYRLWQYTGFGAAEQKRFRTGRAFEVLLKHNVVTGATLAFRGSYKPLILPIPTSWVHDGWIALLIAAVSQVAIIDEPLVFYRQHATNQVGAVKRSRVDASSPFEVIYSQRITKFTCAGDRLRDYIGQSPRSEEILSQIEAKIKHLRVRAALPRDRWRRLPIACKELILLGYHRYAKGARSFVKDVFRPVSVTGKRG